MSHQKHNGRSSDPHRIPKHDELKDMQEQHDQPLHNHLFPQMMIEMIGVRIGKHSTNLGVQSQKSAKNVKRSLQGVAPRLLISKRVFIRLVG